MTSLEHLSLAILRDISKFREKGTISNLEAAGWIRASSRRGASYLTVIEDNGKPNSKQHLQ